MVTELCRKHGMSGTTYSAWKAKFGSFEVSDANARPASPTEPIARVEGTLRL